MGKRSDELPNEQPTRLVPQHRKDEAPPDAGVGPTRKFRTVEPDRPDAGFRATPTPDPDASTPADLLGVDVDGWLRDSLLMDVGISPDVTSPEGRPVGLTRPDKERDEPIALVVVDAALDAFEASEHLKALGYRVIQAAAGRQALDSLKVEPPDLVYLDCWYSGMDVLSFVRAGSKIRPTLGSITIACLPKDPDPELVDLVDELELAAVVHKSWDAEVLDEAVLRAQLPELPDESLGSERSFMELEVAFRGKNLLRPVVELPEPTANPELEPALENGTVIDMRYRVIRFLGRGATSNVYAVEDRELGEDVALKLLTTTMDASPRARQRFRTEMRVCRRIVHPAVVRAFEFGAWSGRLYFTMEFLKGEPLRRLLLRNRWEPVPLGVGMKWLIQTADGLAAAHDVGVVHRDIKPENLFLLKGSNDVKITDFGIARTPAGSAAASIEGMVLGTPAYLSPEQVTGSGPTTPLSDVYALGVVAWELLGGRHPFFRQDQFSLMEAIATEPAPKLRSANKKIPRKLETLVDRMLRKDPKKRPQSTREVVAELEKLQ